MSRDLPSDLATALSTPGTVQGVLAFLAKFNFDSGTIGMWTGIGDIVHDGVTYYGGGNLIGVSPYEETKELQARGMTFTLSGVASNLVEVALNEDYQSRTMKLYLGLVDITSAFALEDGSGIILTEGGDRIVVESKINSIYPLFSGLMDTMDSIDSGETATIQLSCENILSLLKRSKERRYTDQDQKSRYPTDKGLEFIAKLQDKELVW